MKAPEKPKDEIARIKALYSLNLLDSEVDESYELITRVIREYFEVSIVAVSLVDEERQWFKSIQGLDVCQTSREVSFCGHTILQDNLFIVPDATKDERFLDNPLVTGSPNIRYYAAVPLHCSDGYRIGTICIIDTKPRNFSQKKLGVLKEFAGLIERELLNNLKNRIYLEKITAIQEMYIGGKSKRKVFEAILGFLLSHTGSEYGFIGAILKKMDGSPFLKTYAITNIAWNEETTKFYEDHAPEGLEFTNLETLFGYTIKTGEVVISNMPESDPRSGGLPKGHPPMNSYLGVPIFSQDGMIAMFGVANKEGGYSEKDIKSLKAIINLLTTIIESVRSNVIIEDMANKDPLTKVYNRFYFKTFLTDRLAKAGVRGEKDKFCLMTIDCDDFKKVNDFYGHQYGDELLISFSKRLRQATKGKDIIARIGGDEFIVLLDNLNSYMEAGNVAERIIQSSKEAYKIRGKEIYNSASIGMACFPVSGKSVEELVHRSDLALYKAKKSSSRYKYYSDELEQEFLKTHRIEEEVFDVLRNNKIKMKYQPIYSLKKEKIVGLEALIDFTDKALSISTQEFIETAERLGKGKSINVIVIEEVLKDVKTLEFIKSNIKIFINISPVVHDFLDHLDELLRRLSQAELYSKVNFEFELTEGSFINDDKELDGVYISEKLQKNNVGLAIDDFGIKYSSLNRLMEYDFSTIKIDLSFIKLIDSKRKKHAVGVIKAIIGIARVLDIAVIAEGVETKTQLEELKNLNCDNIQGYLFHSKLSWDEAIKALVENKTIK